MTKTPCDHTDSYGSLIVEGGPFSRYPGQRMCMGCDELVPPDQPVDAAAEVRAIAERVRIATALGLLDA